MAKKEDEKQSGAEDVKSEPVDQAEEVKAEESEAKPDRVKQVEIGLIGKKLGMTQVFDDNGRAVPVTIIQAGPCVVVQKKTQSDG